MLHHIHPFVDTLPEGTTPNEGDARPPTLGERAARFIHIAAFRYPFVVSVVCVLVALGAVFLPGVE